MRLSPAVLVNPQAVQAKRLDWEMLKLWAECGLIRLLYLDECGCCCQSPVDYSYSKRGEQKQVRQHRRRGRRINIWGVQEPAVSFDYALMVGTLKTPTHLQLIEWQAQKAQQHFAEAGQLTVIVLDNATPHISRAVQQHFELWQQQGLLLFFLPPHSPQMNRIEDEWLHLKRDQLACRVFEDEFDLAMAIITGVELKAKRRGYQAERFLFN